MCCSGFKRISGLILISFLWSLLLEGAESKCSLLHDGKYPPLLIKNFGSKSIIVQKSESYTTLDDYDQVQVYCGSGFVNFQIYNKNYGRQIYDASNKNILKFQCKASSLLMDDPESHIQLQDNIISCREGIYSIFETRENLTNCEQYQSYALGAKLNTPIIQAALCYDLENTNLKYVSFKLTKLSPILEKAKISYPAGLNELSLMKPLNRLDLIFKFPSNDKVSAEIEKEALTNYWLRIANYELANIVQTSSYNYFESFSSFFNVIWWQNLRKGNWHQFTKLLEKRAKSVAYNLFMGTSGTARVPVVNECLSDMSEPNDILIKIPQFIWAYVQPTDESATDEFVIIGYNSPYFENFPKNDTVLCKDMCDEIDWLKPMEISRPISTFGVMYCCWADEVIGLLDGFPLMEPIGKSTIAQTIITP